MGTRKLLKRMAFIVVMILFCAAFVSAENKTALVIGNGAYRHFQALNQPRPEAIDMKKTLESLGFEVILVLDGTYDQMYDAIFTFESKLNQRGGIAFFHYGGHGVQVNGENYLLPVDKSIPDELRVKSRAVSANEIVASMKASGTKSNIIVLDACRDNPLPAASRSTNSRGLAKLDAPINSIVVYSAEAGKIARDGVFTPTLIEYLKVPGLNIYEVMMSVRKEVFEKTGGKQTPGSYNQLFEPVYLAGTGGNSEPAKIPGFSVEQNYGNVKITTVIEGTLYLDGTRQGTVNAGATARLTDLAVGSHRLEMRYTDGEKETKSVTVWKNGTAPTAFTYKPPSVNTGKVPDGFVLVEAGTFTIGSPSSEENRRDDEKQHTVTLSRDFYMSKYEVTQGEYQSIMGSNPSNTSKGIGDNYPVNQVSWYDAGEYDQAVGYF